MKKLFFRLENMDGKGVYNAAYAGCLDKFNSENHPNPWNDSLFMEDLKFKTKSDEFDKFLFGFCSYRQLLSWFYYEPDFIKLGSDYGIFVSVYQTDLIIIGHAQSAFPKSERTDDNLIKRMTPEEFLNEFRAGRLNNLKIKSSFFCIDCVI